MNNLSRSRLQLAMAAFMLASGGAIAQAPGRSADEVRAEAIAAAHAPDQNGAAGTHGLAALDSTVDERKMQADAIEQAHAADQNGSVGTRGFGDYQGMKDPARVSAEAVEAANAPDQNVAGGSKVDSKVVSTMPPRAATTASK